MNYVYAAVAALILGLGGLAYWQYHRANSMAEDNALLQAANTALKANAELNDKVLVINTQAKQANALANQERSTKLNEAAKANPTWADEPVPAAVADSLR